MTTIHDLPTPALLLDLDVLEHNLSRMAQRAERLGVALRPHIKTHKCIEIGERQRSLGARGITVATLPEATVFAQHGFDDITWAFPVVLTRLKQARALAEHTTLRLVVDTAEAVSALERTGAPFHVWLKVDCGYHRAGVDPRAAASLELAKAIYESSTLTFDGILTHSGHAYDGPGRRESARAAAQERDVMVEFAAKLLGAGVPVEGISVGSTPAMNAVDHLAGITEARPGNYVFYDFIQVSLGACSERDCAVTVLASVVSSQAGGSHAVVDAGALALSKDTGNGNLPHPTMGEIYEDYQKGTLLSDARLTSVSQEHGVVSAPLPVGSHVRILPNHSCLTAACFDEYQVVRGEVVVDRWRIWRDR
jgi:D-serine deaminase-like pyridoxal phosphate-dependent protein